MHVFTYVLCNYFSHAHQIEDYSAHAAQSNVHLEDSPSWYSITFWGFVLPGVRFFEVREISFLNVAKVARNELIELPDLKIRQRHRSVTNRNARRKEQCYGYGP